MCLQVASAQQQTAPSEGLAIHPQEYTIAGLKVEGAFFSSPGTVMQLSGLSIGQKIEIPGSQLSQAIQKLWKQDIFSDIQIRQDHVIEDKIYLSILVIERPRIANYILKGISKSNTNDLKDKIKFVKGTIFTEPKRRSAIRVIKNFFQEKGYLNTQVEIETNSDSVFQNSVNVFFRISKGQKIKIRTIEIEGNDQVAEKDLEAKLRNTKEMRWYRFWKRSKFIRGDFNEDKESILSYYNKNGFRDAEMLNDTFYKINDREMILRIKVYEGPKYYFRNITWNGNNKYGSKLLSDLLGIHKGDVYNTAQLSKKLSMDPNGTDISSLYLDDGYLFFHADPKEIRIDKDSIDIEIQIFEGPQANINKIFLEGNDKTSDRVVLREIRTLPGEKFSRSDLIRTQREIVNLGFFDAEKIDINPIPDMTKGTVDIKYGVQEKPADQLNFQGGYGAKVYDNNGNQIAGGIVGTVGIQFNNFSTRRILDRRAWLPVPSGDGQKLGLHIQVNGSGYQNYSISFVEPWFGGKKPNSLGVSTNYSIQKSTVTGYHLGVWGTSVDLGRRLKFPDDFFRSYTTLSYRMYDVKNGGSVFSGINNGVINIMSLRQTIDRTSIDAPIYSKSGSVVT